MPHGRLTPLGRQLRSVLASIHRARLATTPSFSRPPTPTAHHHRRLHRSATAGAQAAAAVYTPLRNDDPNDPPAAEQGRRFREHGWRRLKRRKRIDHLSEALRDTGKHAAAPNVVAGKLDLSHVNPRSRAPGKDLAERQKKHQNRVVPSPAESKELSLQRILASYIRHQAKSADYLEAEWEAPFTLSANEADFLQFKRFSLSDVAACAAIVTTQDSLAAAELLSQRTAALGPESVPTFIYLNLLRREYIPANALRLLTQCTFNLFGLRARRLTHPRVDNQPVLLVVIRLLRHAREVWPQAMPSIVQFMLQHLQWQERKHGSFTSSQIVSVTYMLNKLMGLVSYCTAVHPFKDNPYQEAAVVLILRHMAEHKPPLHIDRQGYRAVIRVQLAQRKSHTEQQWSELKALSWPPWKHDRTAMDASIGLDYGTTRAGDTLARMREAGYRMLNWEKTAQLYTGWDIDRTPTIQMRALLQQPGAQLSSMFSSDDFTPWAARIASTRTVQEAWACYLAWEDAGLPHDQDVYLEIFRKLYQEEKRQKTGARPKPVYKWRKVWTLFPGDTREVSPLPPSTHLYTYNRTSPPSFDDFYITLKGRGVVFKNHCLNFLVQNAHSLESGLQRLRHSCLQCPEIERLLTLDSSQSLSRLPLPVFKATLELYTRFARSSIPSEFKHTNIDYQKPPVSDRLNLNHPMGRAIELLRVHPIPYRPAWNAVLQGLKREPNMVGFRTLFKVDRKSQQPGDTQGTNHVDLIGAMNAYKAHHMVLRLLREHSIHLDSVGFRALCITTENALTTAWAVLQENVSQTRGDPPEKDDPSYDLRLHAVTIVKRRNDAGRLRKEFSLLVGQGEIGSPHSRVTRPSSRHETLLSVSLPGLLTVPNPAVLHAYVRALGWFADYGGLLEIVRLMRDYQAELAERRNHDRLGEDMMRKVIIALRVFLERSWRDEIAQPLPQQEDTIRAALRQLRTPATPDIMGAVKETVESVEDWGGWASDEEVERYASDARFERFR